MSAFLYFIPNRQAGLSAEELRKAGLGHALDGPVHQQHVEAGGPGGSGGVVAADAEHCEPGRVRYIPAEQDWVETAIGWIGRWKGMAIGPADLMRPKPLDGHFVELADGRKWLCPIARSHVLEDGGIRWRHTFPQTVSLGEDRKWRPGDVVSRFRRLWDLSLAWWDVRADAASTTAEVGETVRFDFDGLHASAAECLAANYRIGAEEISLLGLFDSDSARKILDALIDLPTVVKLTEEMEKKTASTPHAG
jgi:hypothetical protein